MPTTIAAPKKKRVPAVQEDFLPLEGTDHIEFYVGNAKQAAHFYQSALGFQPLAYSGPETGVRERASYVVRQNKITFVLTTPIRAKHPIADHILKHGDGVKAIALKVKDATSAWKETTKRGGKSYMEPKTLKDEHGKIVLSGIHTYGEVVHVFVERDDYTGPFMPGFVKWEPSFRAPETGLQYVDHCVGNVGWNQMNPWVKFYEDVMGFRNILTFDDKDISTEYSALDEQGDEQRKRIREISDQRASRRQKEIAGGRIPRFLRRRRRAAHRHGDEQHHRNHNRSSESRARIPESAFDVLRHAARSRGSHR